MSRWITWTYNSTHWVWGWLPCCFSPVFPDHITFSDFRHVSPSSNYLKLPVWVLRREVDSWQCSHPFMAPSITLGAEKVLTLPGIYWATAPGQTWGPGGALSVPGGPSPMPSALHRHTPGRTTLLSDMPSGPTAHENGNLTEGEACPDWALGFRFCHSTP